MLFTVSSLKTVCSTVLDKKKPTNHFLRLEKLKDAPAFEQILIPLSNSRVLCGNFG